MEEISSMAEALGKTIQASEIYQDYLTLAKKMQTKPRLADCIYRLKEMQAEIAIDQPSDFISLENESKLCDLYSEITMDEDAIGFWHSERKLLSLLEDTLGIISKYASMNLLAEENK